MPKLKDHILPRIKDVLQKEAARDHDLHPSEIRVGTSPVRRETQAQEHDSDAVLFKNDRMYSHRLAKFNYTTYDVRRAEDVINPGTSHRDIMLLADTSDTAGCFEHPFLYARVLGIYHVNVIYTGEGMLDYNARRVDFLWVRWFEYNASKSMRWDDLKLDTLHFPPMASEGAFGFVDPGDVLRGSHIIPAFAADKLHVDRVGLSRYAVDAEDWVRYVVGRYVINFIFVGNVANFHIIDLLIVTCSCDITGAWQ